MKNAKIKNGSYYNSSFSPDSNVIYGDHYDVTNTLLTYVTGSEISGYSIPTLNYLDPNETYNVYYAFDGEFTTGDAGSTLEVCGQLQQSNRSYASLVMQPTPSSK